MKRIIVLLLCAALLLCAGASLTRPKAGDAVPAVSQVLSSKEGILRLHILANSDSSEDQAFKLLVRDAVVPIFEQSTSYADARTFLLTHGAALQETAERVLRENGCTYTVQLSLGTESFPDRIYDGVLYPAGDYDALCIRLGKAQGHNWWCVLFPPLCIITETGEAVDPSTIEPESTLWNLFMKWFGGQK